MTNPAIADGSITAFFQRWRENVQETMPDAFAFTPEQRQASLAAVDNYLAACATNENIVFVTGENIVLTATFERAVPEGEQDEGTDTTRAQCATKEAGTDFTAT